MATAGRHHRAWVPTSRRPHPHLLEPGLACSPSLAHQPLCQRQRPSLRWIRGKTALIRNWLAKRPRFHLHFTPTSASWLNLVERWFALLTEKQLRRGVHQISGELETAIYRYLDVTNEDPKPFVWTKTADQILSNVARFYHRTLNT